MESETKQAERADHLWQFWAMHGILKDGRGLAAGQEGMASRLRLVWVWGYTALDRKLLFSVSHTFLPIWTLLIFIGICLTPRILGCILIWNTPVQHFPFMSRQTRHCLVGTQNTTPSDLLPRISIRTRSLWTFEL